MKDQVYQTDGYASEDEAAFAYNVAALVFEGPSAELNKGMNLSLERKKEIEKHELARIRQFLELPKELPLGPFPQLYDENFKGYALKFDEETHRLQMIGPDGTVLRDTGDLLPPISER